jgi:hypothetical protein
MTLKELWRGLWSEWLSAAFPLQRFIPLVVLIAAAFFLGDFAYDTVQESKKAVVEVVSETSHKLDKFISDVEVQVPSITEATVHEVGQETARVLRI